MQAFVPTSAGVRHGSGVSSRNIASSLPQRNLRTVQSRTRLVISAAGGHGGPPVPKGTPKTFLEELRAYAMALHTREQAPREGKAPSQKPQQAWAPTKEGYLRFLIESKAVYEAFEDIMANDPNTTYRAFVNTGLERTAALEKDIAYMVKTWNLKADPPAPGGPGSAYAGFLRNLASRSPTAFLCHYYNFYFAHTAGGRMIGAQVSKMALDNWMGDFYKWDGEVSQLVEGVRGKINEVTDTWSREDKDSCLRETARTFKYSGGLLAELAGGKRGAH